ncbi:unnamed protein product [Rhizoctonia solani]|uniref:EH domain-containing protein n=1 Tax=Rhizoctonia solani TaxID=456999 RepID=A0A8H3GRN6_9AGAM|nr:unnamed protein product [Rhizoctonia solani]
MYAPTNISAPTLGCIWSVCVHITIATLYCAFAWMVLKLVAYHAAGTPANPVTNHSKATLRRGKKNGVEHSLVISPFHPNAPAHPQDMPFPEQMLRFLDETLNRLATLSPTPFGMVSMTEILQRLTYINVARGPLDSRLNRGIAQVSTLCDQVIAHRTVIFRYLCPTTFLCCLFAGLVAIVGVSVELTMLMCSGALVLVAAGDLGAGEEDESSLVPVRTRIGVFATLFGAGAP